MAVYGVGILLLGCLSLAHWVVRRHEDTQARRAACRHQWSEPRRANVYGEYWSEHCDACGTQRACPPPSRDDPDE